MEMIKGKCGTDCSTCSFKEKFNCSGCVEQKGQIFWGECDIYKCADEKGYAHCGACASLPCGKLTEFIENGHNPDRLSNLQAWRDAIMDTRCVMMKEQEGIHMNMISICGSDCKTCYCFGELCPGCSACKGRVFHAPNGCPIYLCMEEKGLTSCGECSERPCAVWRSTRDPKFTDEAFEQNIRERLERLANK